MENKIYACRVGHTRLLVTVEEIEHRFVQVQRAWMKKKKEE